MTVLLPAVLAIVTLSITGYFCIRWIRGATERTLTEQLEINLKNNLQQNVRSVDARLEHYEKYIEFMTVSIEDMYADKDEMISRGRMFYAPSDTKDYELTRAFASADMKEEGHEDELLFFSNLESIWGPIAKENEGLITTTYLGTKDGLLVSYDRYSYLSCPSPGRETIYNYYVSEWYKRGMSEDGVIYTGVYMDSQGRGLTMTIGSGFKDEKGEPAGVVCMDFDLTSLYDKMFSMGLDDGTFVFALDHEGTIIAPDSDTLDLQEYTGLNLDQLDELKADPDGIMEMEDSVYICIPMERVGWTMFACVPKTAIQQSIYDADNSIVRAFLVFLGIVLLILLCTAYVVNRSITEITHPLELLENDIKIISDGNLDYRASVYRNDEIGDITSGMNEMVDRLNFTLNELKSSQQHADAMSKLATLDTLTGIRNKTAFDEHSKILAEEIENGETRFGFVVLDLNNLKAINDNFGHEKGDLAIKKLSEMICKVFAHSPVFRVGGDEFVVLVRDEDYNNVVSLTEQFLDMTAKNPDDADGEPWENVTAAVGYALYDEKIDSGAESVMSRADKEMYACKKAMKETF